MSDFDQCRKLYHDTFGEDDLRFEDELFNTCFEYCRFKKINDTVVSMFFALPCSLMTGDKTYPAVYIFAVATDVKYRGKGYMSVLLSDYLSDFNGAAFLKPANDGLVEYYKNLRFIPFNAVCRAAASHALIPLNAYKNLSKFCVSTDETYTAMVYCKEILNLENLNFPYTME